MYLNLNTLQSAAMHCAHNTCESAKNNTCTKKKKTHFSKQNRGSVYHLWPGITVTSESDFTLQVEGKGQPKRCMLMKRHIYKVPHNEGKIM